MVIKSGVSHALGAFVTLIVGTMFSKYLWTAAPSAGSVGVRVVSRIRTVTGYPVPTTHRFVGSLVIMVALSFVWGVLYRLA